MDFLTTLKKQVLVIDGAMGTQVQNLDLTDADYGGAEFKMLPDILVFSHPDAVKGIHLDYFRAGANAVETNTFGATPFRLGEYDFSRLTWRILRRTPMAWTCARCRTTRWRTT